MDANKVLLIVAAEERKHRRENREQRRHGERYGQPEEELAQRHGPGAGGCQPASVRRGESIPVSPEQRDGHGGKSKRRRGADVPDEAVASHGVIIRQERGKAGGGYHGEARQPYEVDHHSQPADDGMVREMCIRDRLSAAGFLFAYFALVTWRERSRD